MQTEYLETIRAVDGKTFNLSYHQKRYESVLKFLNVTELKKLKDYLHPPQKGISRCRVLYTPHSISVSYHPYEKKSIRSLKLVYSDCIEYTMKSSDRREIEFLHSLKGKGDDILIIKNSLVTDTSIANIAFKKGNIWITPLEPLLKGTTRARLLESGKIIEADIRVDELKSFSQVALLNAMIDFNVLDSCEFLI